MATGLEKVNFHSNPNKGNAKQGSNYHSIVLISHASKIILKILQVRLQKYVNQELLDVQAGFRKGRETRDKIPNMCWIIEKAEEPEIKLPKSIGSSKKSIPEKHLLLLYGLSQIL